MTPARRRLLTVSILTTAVVVALTIAAWQVQRLSALERAALLATALAPVLIVLSAYLVLRQIQEAATTLRAQLFDATAGRMLDLGRLFVEFPQLRPYFYDGRDDEDLPEPERNRARAVAEMHLDYFESELLRTRAFPTALSLPFDPWIRGLFRSSPAMCRRLAEDGGLGTERWYDLVDRLYAEVKNQGDLAWPSGGGQNP